MAYKTKIVRKSGKYVLDNTNLKILDELIDNGRLPKKEIAKRLSIARGTVNERIDEMEAVGVIEGYTALVNWDLLKLDECGGK